MLKANLSQVCSHKHEVKHDLRLKQVLLVPCLIAYVKGKETNVPIRPDITKKEAKKTKYQYAEIWMSHVGEDILWLKMWGMPKELKSVCYIPGYNGIEEDQ